MGAAARWQAPAGLSPESGRCLTGPLVVPLLGLLLPTFGPLLKPGNLRLEHRGCRLSLAYLRYRRLAPGAGQAAPERPAKAGWG